MPFWTTSPTKASVCCSTSRTLRQAKKTFDDLFMDLAVRLSGQLNLNLVNDKMEEVSTQWLKDVRTYVLARQSEMLKVGIEPGGKTALRLFS